ncbi:4340_t:CDS:2, partial [Racocetra persica]
WVGVVFVQITESGKFKRPVTNECSPMNDLLDYSVGEQSLANLILDLMSYVIEKKFETVQT